VFVGADNITGEIVALKRINTEEEENGFPITAIREVKILKALHHTNVVLLKEIVTSKGEWTFGFVSPSLIVACIYLVPADISFRVYPLLFDWISHYYYWIFTVQPAHITPCATFVRHHYIYLV
jgi:serine/threonine protein kinase